jgi:hypothetical protein
MLAVITLEGGLRDAVIVFVIILLLVAGISSFIAYWQRRSNRTRDSRHNQCDDYDDE